MEQRRETDIANHLDEQDKLLRELRDMHLAHVRQHAETDPAIKELVDLLKGAKLLKSAAIFLATVIGGLWAFFAFVWDHITFAK